MKKRFNCARCGKIALKESGHFNRSRSIGAPLYCGSQCAGLARRKSTAEKKETKRIYDAALRARLGDEYRRQRRESYARNYDPVKAAAYRKSRMHLHVEYCRQPEYKAWKRDYDRRLRASEYRKFADAHMLLVDIEREVRSRITDYEIRVQNGTINKHLQRRRHYEQVTGNR